MSGNISPQTGPTIEPITLEGEEIEGRARLTTAMKHFDSTAFREGVLAHFEASLSIIDSDRDQAEISEDSLTEKQQEVKAELADDFRQLNYDTERQENVDSEINDQLAAYECTKALTVLRENTACMTRSETAFYQARIWETVAQFDSRFGEIARAFREYLGDPQNLPSEKEGVQDRSIHPGDILDYFADNRIRELILRSFLSSVGQLDNEGSEDAYSRWREIEQNPKLHRSVMSYTENFALLCAHNKSVNTREKTQTAVNRWLGANECGKALKIVRSNAIFLEPADTATLRAKIWQQVALFDNRFHAVAAAYEETAARLYRAHEGL